MSARRKRECCGTPTPHSHPHTLANHQCAPLYKPARKEDGDRLQLQTVGKDGRPWRLVAWDCGHTHNMRYRAWVDRDGEKSYDSTRVGRDTRPEIRLPIQSYVKICLQRPETEIRTHSFATGPVIAEPFISPLGLTITPALSCKTDEISIIQSSAEVDAPRSREQDPLAGATTCVAER